MKISLILLLLFLSIKSFAETRSFGHLLSRNDYMMEDSRCMLGIEFTGCRLDSTLIGTSPFLLSGYSLKNIYIRQSIRASEDVTNTIDLGLVDNLHKKKSRDENFDSEIPKRDSYDMSAIMFNFVTTFHSENNRKLSWNNSIFYYPNYRRPFSLRRPDPKIRKLQLNSSLLFENPFSEHTVMVSEIGLLQFNGKYPRIQAGASLDFHTGNFLIKIGFSATSTLSGFFVSTDRPVRRDYQQELLRSEEGYYQTLDNEKMMYDFAIHPEINLQYSF